MTTIDKQSFKITIPSVVSIIACTTTIIIFLYSFRDQNTAENNSVKAEIQSLKTEIEVQGGQVQSLKNDMKVESADRKNDRAETREELKDMRMMLIRMSPYNQKPTASN